MTNHRARYPHIHATAPMNDRSAYARPPLTLIVSSQEWHSRSLESILGPCGHAVLRAYNGKQAIERAVSARPDLIILDTDLPDRDGLEVCRELRAHPSINRCTPIVMTNSGHPNRQKRLDALRAGAWDLIGAALDGEELPLRLDAFVRAKQESDRIREESLLDELTGLYNIRGLARRARELGSQAFREKEAFACLVITPVMDGAEAERDAIAPAVVERLARILRDTGRTSDVIGTLGPGEFAIVAHGTDSAGAARLAQRVSEAAAKLFGDEQMRVAVGYDAVPNYQESPIDPSDMLTRASAAMRLSRAGVSPQTSTIRPFNGSQLN
jgi:diguanylate cyclase (GGDEF)-like protein